MSINRELIRRGVIVPTFKIKKINNFLTFFFKGRYYLNYLKARTKARSLNIKSTAKWKLYCYLNDTLPHGVPESPEIVYRNNGWVNFNDWLGIKVVKKFKNKRKTAKSRSKTIKLKPLDLVKNYKFSKLASKRLPNALNAVKLIGNLSRRSSYEYTDTEAQSIIKSLSKAMRDLRRKIR